MKKEIDNRNKELWEQVYASLFSLYGDDPPVQCLNRLVVEEIALYRTDAIQCFAALGKLCTVAKARSVPMIVSGSVNSSFAAWLMGATMVNPLPPHYRCPACGRIEFIPDAGNGFDLPAKKCSCGKELIRDGHNIPYQSFTQGSGNGIAITILIAEDFKPTAISTLQECYKETAEILPVRFNADDPSSYVQYVVLPVKKEKPTVSEDGYWDTNWDDYEQWYTGETWFFFAVDEQISQLHQQQNNTGIPLPNLQTLLNPAIAEALLKSKYQTLLENPEYLPLQEPASFDLLLRIDGLSCGEGVWGNNIAELLQSGQADFWGIPAFRDDVFQAVSSATAKHNIYDPSLALLVVDNVRTGRYARKPIPHSVETSLRQLGLQDWYINLLKEVRFLCHKGHCVTHVIVDLLCEWYSMQVNNA